MRKKIVVANWKMNGTLAQNQALVEELQALSGVSNGCVIVCPSYLHLEAVKEGLHGTGLKIGAQDVSQFTSGAYTGQISAQMLADIGCEYVIIGHSERRQYCDENSDIIAKKILISIDSGLTPIFCVGETKHERALNQTEAVLREQVTSVVSQCGVEAFGKCLLAYEPVWAIGTGETATPEIAQAAHAYIRSLLAEADTALASQVPLLYGGSVNGGNASALFSMPDIDGGLVGGASLKAAEFIQICEKAADISR